MSDPRQLMLRQYITQSPLHTQGLVTSKDVPASESNLWQLDPEVQIALPPWLFSGRSDEARVIYGITASRGHAVGLEA
jgi:hypothetical protein